MTVIDDIKTMLSISDFSQDNILQLYIRKAESAIRRYLNLSADDITDILSFYPDAVCQFVVECKNRAGDEGIKQSTLGERENTYQIGLSAEVKSLLPLPKVKMG